MAEAHKEAGLKAADFYVGVVELFAVFLPGAILDFLILQRLQAPGSLVGKDFEFFARMFSPPVVAYLAFAIASYVTGHLLFALGGLVLDPVYGRYKVLFETEQFKDLRQEAGAALKEGVPGWDQLVDNALAWTEEYLRMFSGAGTAQLERLEADHKFFRSLCLILLLAFPLPLFILEHVHQATRQLSLDGQIGNVIFMGLLLAAQPLADTWLKRKKRQDDNSWASLSESGKTKQKEQVIDEIGKKRKACWSWWLLWPWCIACLLPPVLWMMPYWDYWKITVVVLAGWLMLTLLCGWRFFDLRKKRTRIAYQLLILARKFKTEGTAASQAGEGAGSTG